MKKLMLTLLFLFLFIHSYQAFKLNDCMKEITLKDLNSKNLLTYIKENDLIDKVTQVCSDNICSNINVGTLEKDIKEFIKRNLNYLNLKDTEHKVEAELKGFRIDKIKINAC